MGRWVTDQLERQVEVVDAPQRIISLVPSQTELLHDLGMGERVVGITKFCIHPDNWFRSKTRIGGTKQVKHELIASLQPDLIIANKEENTPEDVERLAQHYPVWVSDVRTLPQAIQMIRDVGALVNAAHKAEQLALAIEASMKTWPTFDAQRVAYLIWRKPWMGVGADTFINAVLERLEVVNVLAGKGRYPKVTLEELAERNTDEVWLSSEPFPFKERHMDEIRAALPTSKVRLVDGELFSWYGSRMLRMATYFQQGLKE